jgi:glutamyl-tRNA reductase
VNTHINIEEAICLVNKRGTTLDEVCKFIYQDIEDFQNSREKFYLQELKNEFNGDIDSVTEEMSDEISDKIFHKIQKDTKNFSISYSKESVDAVLDAINQKRFKYKKGSENLLVLLCSLREINEQS